MDAVKACVFPPISGPAMVGGLSVIEVAGMVKFVVAQTVGSAKAHPCTVTFCDGYPIKAASVKVEVEQLLVQVSVASPTPLAILKFASCGL
jgi:hypothetical protein